MESRYYYHVTDRVKLPYISAGGLTPSSSDDPGVSSKTWVFDNELSAKRYLRNKLGGVMFRFSYKMRLSRDKESGFLFIESIIPTSKLEVYSTDEKGYIPFSKYYKPVKTVKSEESDKLKKVASTISNAKYNGRDK